MSDKFKTASLGAGIRWGIMGPSLVFELGGGRNGVSGLMTHLDESVRLWLNDMADWKAYPFSFLLRTHSVKYCIIFLYNTDCKLSMTIN